MKYRKFLIYIFYAFFLGALVLLLLQFSIAPVLSGISVFVALTAALVAAVLLFLSREAFFNFDSMKTKIADNESALVKMQGEIGAKDLLLNKEKEILLFKHGQLEEALEKQKKINMDIEKLKREYEKIIAINNNIWFMENPHEILEEIAQHAVEAVGAKKCAIIVNDMRGIVAYTGISVCPQEEARHIFALTGKQLFDSQLKEMFDANRYIKIDKQHMPEPLVLFYTDRYAGDYCAFPIRFRNDLRGIAYFSIPKGERLSSTSLITIEMFLSVVSVYFERSELITKEFELDNILLESEKMMSITNLTEGIAHNINSPLNTVMLSQEMIEQNVASLKEKYPDEIAIDKLTKTVDRVKKAASSINMIVSNIASKSMLDRNQKQDRINLHDLIKNEMLFMQADMEFKHHFVTQAALCEKLPSVYGLYRDFSYLFESSLYLMMHMFTDEPEKKITVATSTDGQKILLSFILCAKNKTQTLVAAMNGSQKTHIAKVNIPNMNRTMERYGITFFAVDNGDTTEAIFKIPGNAGTPH